MAKTSNKAHLNPVLRNLIWAIISVIALIVLSSIILGLRTRNGQEIDVPDFYGLTMEEAEELASQNHVRLDVTDSVYVDKLARGAVFSQNPDAGDKVKAGRRILITINATQLKTVRMPSLIGLSLRGAKTDIISKGLTVGKLYYTPDMATNYVLEQRVAGSKVKPGSKVVAGQAVDLVLGVNPDENATYVPFLSGMDIEMAADVLFENSLNLHSAKYDETVRTALDSSRALIYSQTPAASVAYPFPLGTDVVVYLTVDSTKISAPSLTE